MVDVFSRGYSTIHRFGLFDRCLIYTVLWMWSVDVRRVDYAEYWKMVLFQRKENGCKMEVSD